MCGVVCCVAVIDDLRLHSRKCIAILVKSQVLITVPLSILKAREISFEPELPDRKLRAIDRLGAGVIEKVGMYVFHMVM